MQLWHFSQGCKSHPWSFGIWPFDNTWKVKILGLELYSPLVICELAQALAGKISSLKITGEFFKQFMVPYYFEKLLGNLKKVFLKTSFHSLDIGPFMSCLTQLTSLEELLLHYVLDYLSRDILYCFSISTFQPVSFGNYPWMDLFFVHLCLKNQRLAQSWGSFSSLLILFVKEHKVRCWFNCTGWKCASIKL